MNALDLELSQVRWVQLLVLALSPLNFTPFLPLRVVEGVVILARVKKECKGKLKSGDVLNDASDACGRVECGKLLSSPGLIRGDVSGCLGVPKTPERFL